MAGTGGTGEINLHASCVALGGRGLLIRGASGSGKSSLALELMALGCGLVADDRVVLRRAGDGICAEAPPPLRGLIEARGLGLLNAEAVGPVRVVAVLDLDQAETDRLPQSRSCDLLGQSVPLLRKPQTPHPAPALLQYLRAGRQDGE